MKRNKLLLLLASVFAIAIMSMDTPIEMQGINVAINSSDSKLTCGSGSNDCSFYCRACGAHIKIEISGAATKYKGLCPVCGEDCSF